MYQVLAETLCYRPLFDQLGNALLLSSCERLLGGFFVTLELLVLATLVGLLLALPISVARLSQHRLLAWPAYAYSYFFRGTPFLIQLFLLYYGLAQFEWVRNSPLWLLLRDAWSVALLAMSLNTAAYTTEILRGSILALPNGQREAAKSLGMGPFILYRHILFPQAWRLAWPAYSNEIIFLLKASALASTITVMDLMGHTRTLFSRSYDLEVFLYAAALYLLLTNLILWLLRQLQRGLFPMTVHQGSDNRL